MKTKTKLVSSALRLLFALALLVTLHAPRSTCLAQGTAFTYQGRLTDGTNVANGNYDLTFSVWITNNGPGQVGVTQTNRPVAVSNGLFTVALDFGSGIFTGDARWLEIGVRTNGSAGPYSTLSPRQPLSAAPYAVMAGNAGNLGGQASSAFVAKAGDTMTGSLSLPANGLALAGNQLVASGGKIGIGTSSPDAPLTVGSSSVRGIVNIYGGASSLATLSLADQRPGGHFYTFYAGSSGAGNLDLVDQNTVSTVLTVRSNGNVGLGTTTPNAPLDIFVASANVGTRDFLRLGYGANDYHSIRAFFNGNPGNSSLSFNVEYASGDIRPVMTLKGNAVGIGTDSPAYLLDVQGSRAVERLLATNDSSGSVLEFRNITPPGPPNVTLGQVTFRDAAANVLGRIRYDADTGFEFSAGGTPQMYLDGAGTLTAKVLQINGADVAEPFELSTKDIPKGSVVIIDEENPGQLKRSDRAYDTRVAGILSGAKGINSGIRLEQQGFNDHGENVALSGRVYALADASFGAIKPGDLLTTSDTRGHCMKVTDHARAQGAIIGKAMSALEKGKGMVLVLVSLQ